MEEARHWKDLLEALQGAFKDKTGEPDTTQLAARLQDQPAGDVALAMEELEPAQAQHVFAALDEPRAAEVLAMLGPDLTKTIADSLEPDRLDRLLAHLPQREAAALLADQPTRAVEKEEQSGTVPPAVAEDVEQRAKYPPGSAGHLMTTDFVRLRPDMTIADALAEVRRTDPTQDIPADMCVVESDPAARPPRDRLVGIISIRDALMKSPETLIRLAMVSDVLCVNANLDDTDAARLLSKHKFSALPVTDNDNYLVGLIPADDLMQVALSRLHEQYSKAVGTDAAAMDRMTAFQAAWHRVPWLLGTMGIELGAAAVVTHFNSILEKVILLASFMPVISAVSGNIGLQAAAITVRSLDEGRSALKAAGLTLLKELFTTLFMALVCGLALGLIGAFWSKHLMFGAVIGLALTCSMLTAAFMGTLFPMISKKLGFDPATTAGPFETAFQDIIGFGVFLSLATLLANHI